MSNPSAYVVLVAQCLQDDDVLNTLVDGEFVPGYQRTNADDHLVGTHKACIGVRNLDLIGQDLPGCDYHGISDYDQQVEISITQIAQNDTYISSIMAEIMRIMKKPLSKTIGGVTYSVSTDGRARWQTVNDPAFLDRIETNGVYRLRYLDS
jgi:hypothetical protein